MKLSSGTDDLVMLDLDHEGMSTTWIFERRNAVTPGTVRGLDTGMDGDAWVLVAGRAVERNAARLADRGEGGISWVELADPDNTCSADSRRRAYQEVGGLVMRVRDVQAPAA